MRLRRFFLIICVILVLVFLMQFYFVGMLSKGRTSPKMKDIGPSKIVTPHHSGHKTRKSAFGESLPYKDRKFERSSQPVQKQRKKEVKKPTYSPKSYETVEQSIEEPKGPHDEKHPHSKYSHSDVLDHGEEPVQPEEPMREAEPIKKEEPMKLDFPEEKKKKKKPLIFDSPEDRKEDKKKKKKKKESGEKSWPKPSFPKPKCPDSLTEEEKEWEKRKEELMNNYDPRYIFEGIYTEYEEELKQLTGILKPGDPEVDVQKVAALTESMMESIKGFAAALTNNTEVDPIPLFTAMLQTLSDQFNDDAVPNRNIFISYGDRCCKTSLPANIKSAKETGKFDEAYAMTGKNLSESFKKRLDHILRQSRGGGYWVWKSKIILDMLMKYPLSKNVILFYGDAGMYWKKDARKTMDRFRKGPRDTIIFSMAYEERQWSKRDAFVLMGVDREEFYTYPVAHATHVAFRNTLFSRWFAAMWNYYCHDDRIVTDRANTQGLPNLKGHSAHRHDQSILGLLTKKFNIKFDEFGYNFPTSEVLVITRNKS